MNVQLWTAFILGLAGSLHCAAMCGPLLLLVPVSGPGKWQQVLSKISYNAGRIVVYAMLGGLFGAFGQTFVILGLQRWLSLAAGILIILGLVGSTRPILVTPLGQSVVWIKSKFGLLLRKRTLWSIAALGALNGLLPCGLVYVACAGSAVTGSPLGGIEYMCAFGFGTLPMLFAIAIASSPIRIYRAKAERLIPVTVVLVGLLLIVRGLALGIPYLSPAVSGHCPACIRAGA